ncbi:MAG: hypothetical protein HY738_06025, partial [Bacteroidia bacterium]|nr:hypothetical protein [Bacteroidia bacterium]
EQEPFFLKVVKPDKEGDEKGVQGFLSPDPSSSKFPWQTPYLAFDGNPIINIDPDGRSAVESMDWFENELTGAVMNVKGKSEVPESMKGEGWVNIGKDEMFGVENIPEADITTYAPLAARMFMSEQDYKLAPKQVLVYNKEIQESPVSVGKYSVSITRGKEITFGEKATYTKKDYVVTKRTDTKTIEFKSSYNLLLGVKTTEEIYRETLHYGPKDFSYSLGKFLEFGSIMSGKHDYRIKISFNQWDYFFNRTSDALTIPIE